MNQQEGRALDHYLTTPPSDCKEDGCDWKWIGQDEDGRNYYKCRRCGEECEG